jgi:hypothetical protein
MASTTPAEGAPAVAMGGDGGGGGVAQLRLPSADEIRAQDIFNNCAVRTAVSGVMGTCAPNFSLACWLLLLSFFFWSKGGSSIWDLHILLLLLLLLLLLFLSFFELGGGLV